MKILITGSTGFVGRHLVPKLLEANHELLELTIEPQVSEFLYGNKTQKYTISDNQPALVSCIESFNPEVVVHLAAYLTSLDDYKTLNGLLNANITFLCRLLDALKNCTIKLFVNTGTFAEYYKGDDTFDPAYLYAATKTASRSFLDYYSKVYNFKQATLVPYTIYGGNDTQKKVIDYIYDSIDSDIPVDMSPGEQVLDFIHIDDVIAFYLVLIDKFNEFPEKSNYKLGTGIGHTLKEVSKIIENKTGKKTNINWGGKEYRKSDIMYAVAKNQYVNFWHAKISIEAGIHNYISNKTKL